MVKVLTCTSWPEWSRQLVWKNFHIYKRINQALTKRSLKLQPWINSHLDVHSMCYSCTCLVWQMNIGKSIYDQISTWIGGTACQYFAILSTGGFLDLFVCLFEVEGGTGTSHYPCLATESHGLSKVVFTLGMLAAVWIQVRLFRLIVFFSMILLLLYAADIMRRNGPLLCHTTFPCQSCYTRVVETNDVIMS